MNLYIMRHGETEWNKRALMQGSVDIPLNEYGIELAEKTRDGLILDVPAFDKIFSSPLIRAKKTAEIVAKAYNLPITCDERIREMCFGKYEGIPIGELRTNPEYEEINKCFDDPENYVPDETAESYADMYERVNSFLGDVILPLEDTCENVLVVCHGAITRIFISVLAQIPLKDLWKTIHQPNCSVNLATRKEGQWKMEEIGRLYYEKQIDPGRRFV